MLSVYASSNVLLILKFVINSKSRSFGENLNLHYRIFFVLKFFLTYFFSFLFHFNSRICNTDAFFIFKIKLIKKYNLNSQKQISSIIQKPSKKSRTFKIKKHLN